MKFFLTSIILLAVSCSIDAQTRWVKYDSIYAENLFQPNFSNLLMPRGYVEVLASNSLLSANHTWATKSSSLINLGRRYTYNYVTTIVNMGVSRNNRFNAGLEVHQATGYQDADPESSSMNIFKGSSPGYVTKESAVTSFGPRIKWRPLKRNLHFVYISTLQIPLLNNVKKEAVLGQSNVQWGNQALYSFNLGKKVFFFAQEDLYISFAGSTTQYYDALSFFSYYLLTRHLFPFVSAGYATTYLSGRSSFRNQNQSLPLGGGLQYQFSLRFTVNAYYNQYLWGKNYNDWRTINLGLRAVF